MRRQVRPFVTEYKGTARRPREGAAGPFGSKLGDEVEPQREGSEKSETQPGWAAFSDEDSYEAALRAADALFSAPGASAQVPNPKAQTRREAAPAATNDGAEPMQERTGRILRVVDEPPLQQFADLEAARAPKRRGRKPGSKNKPKPPQITALGESLPESRLPAAGVSAVDAVSAASTVVSRPPVDRTWRDERYAWVRTKLRPGEQWKRRLPKVIW